MTGEVLWKNSKLSYRQLTAPMSWLESVVVADLDGYAHLLSRYDGHYMGRIDIGSSTQVQPLIYQQHLYTYDNKGKLTVIDLDDSK